jgi:hypothetical protein
MQTQRRRFGQALVSAGFACACLATAATLHAQDRSGSVQLRAGAALGVAMTSVGGETSTDVGPLLTGQFGVAVSSRTNLTLALAVQPFKAHNPVADEAFTAVSTLAGLELGLGKRRRVYVRPELGLVFRSWSGSEVFVSSETGFALGVVIGREWPIGAKLGLAAEGFVRLSGADELSTILVGLGLNLVPVGAQRPAS